MKSSVAFARTRVTDGWRSRISRGRSSSNSARNIWLSATSRASPDRTRRIQASTLRSHALQERSFPSDAAPHVPTHSQLVFRARGRATAQGGSRLRDPRIHRALWGRRRGQACRIGIAARTARAVAKTLRVLERRPGANRDAHEREFNPEASRRARTVRSRRAASVPRRRSIARAGVFVSTVTRAGAGFQPSPARSSQASAPTARHSAASRPKTCATPAAPAAKSRMRRATDRLRDSFSSSPYFQAGWLVTPQKARTFEVVRRSVPPDCGAEMFVDDQHRASRSPCHGGRRFAAIDTHPLHGR